MSRKMTEVEVQDPDGEEWHRIAGDRWEKAMAGAAAPDEALDRYTAPALPDFRRKRSGAVTREVLGRFVQDRDTGVVHDISTAVPSCRVDAIRNATFYHFWSEALEHAADAAPCADCL